MARSFLVLAVAVATCSNTPTGSSCPTGSTLTYDHFGRQFFASYCDRCHVRRDQPILDGPSAIQAHLTAIDTSTAAGPDAVNTSMPEGTPQPTEAERRQLGEWLACGAP